MMFIFQKMGTAKSLPPQTVDKKENVTVSMNDLVPKNHLLRVIDKAIDFNFIYDEVKNLYRDKCRPRIDPVSLFKIVFIQYLFGIRSMRQTIKEKRVPINSKARL